MGTGNKEYRKEIIDSFREKTNKQYHRISGLEPYDLELSIWNYVESKIERAGLGI